MPMQKALLVLSLYLFFFSCSSDQNDDKIALNPDAESALDADSNFIPVDQTIQFISASQLVQMLAVDKAYLIDGRSVEDFNKKRIGSAIHLDFKDLPLVEAKLKMMDVQRTFYIYGNNNQQSKDFGKWLIQQGVNQVYILEGGLNSWENAQLPIIH